MIFVEFLSLEAVSIGRLLSPVFVYGQMVKEIKYMF